MNSAYDFIEEFDIFVFMNVYEMYILNGCKFGFYIVRDSWGFTVAKITGIEGVKEGNMIPGKAPYFGNPKVIAEFYKTPNISKITNENVSSFCTEENRTNNGEISCPGTGGYTLFK